MPRPHLPTSTCLICVQDFPAKPPCTFEIRILVVYPFLPMPRCSFKPHTAYPLPSGWKKWGYSWKEAQFDKMAHTFQLFLLLIERACLGAQVFNRASISFPCSFPAWRDGLERSPPDSALPPQVCPQEYIASLWGGWGSRMCVYIHCHGSLLGTLPPHCRASSPKVDSHVSSLPSSSSQNPVVRISN